VYTGRVELYFSEAGTAETALFISKGPRSGAEIGGREWR